MAKIKITIPRDTDGGTKLEVEGVTGPECVSLTEGLSRVLGSDLDRELTDEYEQVPEQTELEMEGEVR